MSDKKYPAIYKNKYGVTALTYNKNSDAVVLSKFKNGCVFNISGRIAVDEYANITREYLTNTRGEVKSERHAKFIEELAENAGFAFVGAFSTKDRYFNFYKNSLFFWPCEDFSKDSGETLITIPEPPEDWSMSHYDEQAEEFEMKQKEMVMKENGDNLHFGGEDKCEGWPCVGDEVLYVGQNVAFKDCIFSVIGICRDIGGKKVVTMKSATHGLFSVFQGEWLQKPKSPEEELRDDIEYAIHHFEGDKVAGRKWLMSKYNITKKPQ